MELCMCLLSFGMGYILARLNTVQGEQGTTLVSGGSIFSRPQKAQQRVSIDESKYVTDVDTDDLVKTEETSIGTVSKSRDDISAAKNKLASLKRSKG